MRRGVPPVGANIFAWANDLRRWIESAWDRLTYRTSGASATQDGLLMWDTSGYPVVSYGGEWRRVLIVSDVPATASSTGATGEISMDSGYIYVCTGTDTWKRVAISTW